MNERRNDAIFHAASRFYWLGQAGRTARFWRTMRWIKNLVAVDGGLAHLLAGRAGGRNAYRGYGFGYPQARREAAAGCRILEISDQNSTDLEKALTHCRAPWFAGFGF